MGLGIFLKTKKNDGPAQIAVKLFVFISHIAYIAVLKGFEKPA